MALSPGTRVGAYEILSALGAGGMGEVYRARDTKLNRDVAVKVLLPAVATDPDRIARFSREAQVLASLNHPNIAQIHGLEETNDLCAIVMELVEGPTLADRIAAAAIPLEEALPMARQLAEALEGAHEKGIIHRDLKPANIKVRGDGTVKVLDFGLAKAFDPTGSFGSNATTSPTLSLHATQAGVILGTAAYMAPEQARGRAVDRRADIWAFGCVFFEMLTGVRAFMGDDVTDTIVAVVSKEPDWQALPASAASARPLLARCLRKDPKQRLQAIGDARILIEELINGAADTIFVGPPAPRRPRRFKLAIAAVAALLSIAALGMYGLRGRASDAHVLPARFELTSPPSQSLAIQGSDRDIAISPDGRYIAYRAGLTAQLVVRPIDRLDGHALAGASNVRQPFFSPDSQWVGFFDGSNLKKVPVGGGPVITIGKNQSRLRGASWGDDNNIVYATTEMATGLLRVSASGGEPTVLTTPDAASGETNHWYPSVLPGGRGVLFTVASPNRPDTAQVAVLDLQSGQRKVLIRRGSQAEYVHSGHLLYAAAGALHAVRFDLERLQVLSDPIPVVDGLWMAGAGVAGYAVSRLGTLVYIPAPSALASRSLVWVDRTGRESPIAAPPRPYADVRLSPDGTRVALTIPDQEFDIWIWDFTRETLTRLTFAPTVEQHPVWMPDGRRIAFASQQPTGAFNLFAQAADGTGAAERLTGGEHSQSPRSVSPDASGIVGIQVSPKTAADLVWFPLNHASRRSDSSAGKGSGASLGESLLSTTFYELSPELSPDGHFIAYESNESGRDEIYVRPFPRVNDGRWQVSTHGGTRPAWAANGRELFYLDLANALTTVAVQIQRTTFSSGNPVKVLDSASVPPRGAGPRTYDVSPDGTRFLMIKDHQPAGDRNATQERIVVVLNWFEELNAKLPRKP